jgi:hypothetical protein
MNMAEATNMEKAVIVDGQGYAFSNEFAGQLFNKFPVKAVVLADGKQKGFAMDKPHAVAQDKMVTAIDYTGGEYAVEVDFDGTIIVKETVPAGAGKTETRTIFERAGPGKQYARSYKQMIGAKSEARNAGVADMTQKELFEQHAMLGFVQRIGADVAATIRATNEAAIAAANKPVAPKEVSAEDYELFLAWKDKQSKTKVTKKATA